MKTSNKTYLELSHLLFVESSRNMCFFFSKVSNTEMASTFCQQIIIYFLTGR